MRNAEDMLRILGRIDGRGYRAYRDLEGEYALRGFTLIIDHVQGDPFASPSRVRARVDAARGGFAPELLAPGPRRLGLEDFLARAFAAATARIARGHRGLGTSGLIAIDAGGQEVIERTAVRADPRAIEARFVVGLPSAGRQVDGRAARAMLLEEVPAIVAASLVASALDGRALARHVAVVEDHAALQEALGPKGLVAFVANGAVLPRASGVDQRPLSGAEVVPFRSPAELEVTLATPNAGPARGMGIPEGVTLVVGGGFHGKSTLLRALERGVYPHVPGDGREQVATVATAVKIRAEDGRRVERVDISPFIGALPGGRDTAGFSTDNASGSTSQAANIVEALEVGASCLLIDEDTSATNFMIRDARMQALVPKPHEPITPFIDRVRELHRERGVSTVLVMGGSGDYLEVADRVIAMTAYRPADVTAAAREVVARLPGARQAEVPGKLGPPRGRRPRPGSFPGPGDRGRPLKVAARGLHTLLYGRESVDLSALEQLVDPSQTRAIGALMRRYAERYLARTPDLRCGLEAALAEVAERGLEVLGPRGAGDLALPRLLELAAAVNRLRTLRVEAAER